MGSGARGSQIGSAAVAGVAWLQIDTDFKLLAGRDRADALARSSGRVFVTMDAATESVVRRPSQLRRASAALLRRASTPSV